MTMAAKIFWSLILILLAQGSMAQSAVNVNTDSLSSADLDLALHLDSLNIAIGIFEEPESEFFPLSDSPEVIQSRLDSIQQAIPLTYNERIHAFINYFTIKDRDYTRMVLSRTDRYFPLFEKYLAQYNLPQELKYLAIVESGLNPKAISRAQAVGLWQFMPATGRYFGLHNNGYIDDRMDPEKSTEAACKYLKQLYTMFNDWELALAAYNSGPGNVRKAIRRSGYKKKFWEIYRYLPRETRSYLPQFVAIAYTINYAQAHNLSQVPEGSLLPHDTLAVNHFLNLATLANLTGTTLEAVQKLNPSILHQVIPETGKTYIVRIPSSAKENLLANRAFVLDSASRVGKAEAEALVKKITGNTYGRERVTYFVKSGDVLGSIAEKHRVRVEDLKKWNNLQGTLIRAGQKLNIWVIPGTSSAILTARKAPVKINPDTKVYTVQPGDTLWDISRKFEGLTIEKIKHLNNLNSHSLQPGQTLILD